MSAQFTLFFDGHLWVGVYEIDDGESVRAARVVFGKEPSAAELHEFVREHGAELVRRAHGAVPVVGKGADAGEAGGGAQRMAAKAMRERGVSTKAQEALKADMESRGEERASARRREQKRAADEAYARRQAKARQRRRGR